MDEFIKEGTGELQIGKLLGSIARLQGSRADRQMEHLGLFRGQAFLLITLSSQDGLTHSEIAEKLGISPAAATKVIKRLEELHFLKRQPDPNDERISRVFLEEEGWAVIQQIRCGFQKMDQALLANITPEDQKTLFHLLLQVHSNLVEQGFDSPQGGTCSKRP